MMSPKREVQMARKRDEQLAARGAQALIRINRSRGVETDSKYVRLAARAAPSQRRRASTDDSASDERPHPGQVVLAVGAVTILNATSSLTRRLLAVADRLTRNVAARSDEAHRAWAEAAVEHTFYEVKRGLKRMHLDVTPGVLDLREDAESPFQDIVPPGR